MAITPDLGHQGGTGGKGIQPWHCLLSSATMNYGSMYPAVPGPAWTNPCTGHSHNTFSHFPHLQVPAHLQSYLPFCSSQMPNFLPMSFSMPISMPCAIQPLLMETKQTQLSIRPLLLSRGTQARRYQVDQVPSYTKLMFLSHKRQRC